MIIQCYVTADTMRRLEHVAELTGRSIDDLTEAAIAEQAMMATRDDTKFAKPTTPEGTP
jgi:hypothetical protein